MTERVGVGVDRHDAGICVLCVAKAPRGVAERVSNRFPRVGPYNLDSAQSDIDSVFRTLGRVSSPSILVGHS